MTPQFTRELTSTISSKGQVTIPVEIRRYMGISTNDKIAFIVKNGGEVHITPVTYPDISSLQGAVGSLCRPLNFKQIAYEDFLDTAEFDKTIKLKRISLKEHKKKK